MKTSPRILCYSPFFICALGLFKFPCDYDPTSLLLCGVFVMSRLIYLFFSPEESNFWLLMEIPLGWLDSPLLEKADILMSHAALHQADRLAVCS